MNPILKDLLKFFCTTKNLYNTPSRNTRSVTNIQSLKAW